jgi:hypothetical protein
VFVFEYHGILGEESKTMRHHVTLLRIMLEIGLLVPFKITIKFRMIIITF